MWRDEVEVEGLNLGRFFFFFFVCKTLRCEKEIEMFGEEINYSFVAIFFYWVKLTSVWLG